METQGGDGTSFIETWQVLIRNRWGVLCVRATAPIMPSHISEAWGHRWREKGPLIWEQLLGGNRRSPCLLMMLRRFKLTPAVGAKCVVHVVHVGTEGRNLSPRRTIAEPSEATITRHDLQKSKTNMFQHKEIATAGRGDYESNVYLEKMREWLMRRLSHVGPRTAAMHRAPKSSSDFTTQESWSASLPLLLFHCGPLLKEHLMHLQRRWNIFWRAEPCSGRLSKYFIYI